MPNSGGGIAQNQRGVSTQKRLGTASGREAIAGSPSNRGGSSSKEAAPEKPTEGTVGREEGATIRFRHTTM